MNYEINLSSLQQKINDFQALNDDTIRLSQNFNSNYINNLSSTEIGIISKQINNNINKLFTAYNNCYEWLNSYYQDLLKLENNLTNFSNVNVATPIDFAGQFTNVFSKKTIPTLQTNGDKTMLCNTVEAADQIEQLTSQYNIGTSGQFVAASSKGVYGYIISSIDGKRHIVFRQSEISGWGQKCNRAAAASIASAYTTNPWDAVTAANNVSGGLGFKSANTENYFSQFGLKSKVTNVKGSYDTIKNDLISTLSSGNYAMFDLSEPGVVGQSGQKWTSTRHWLAALDIKKTGNGPNDYAIFISDSGHKGSTNDYGLGTGWYNINEFTGQRIENFTTITRT